MSPFVSAIGQVDRGVLGLALITTGTLLVTILILKASFGTNYEPRRTHSKVGLPWSRSNLSDQDSPAYQPKPGHLPRLQSLFIYPLKSCQGIGLTRSRVLPTGLEFDRLYTFAQLRKPQEEGEEPVWQFLTQRQLPLLASVKVDLWLPNATTKEQDSGGESGAFLTVKFPWTGPGLIGVFEWTLAKLRRGLDAAPEKHFMLPIDFPSKEDITQRGYEYANIKIWKEITTALNMVSEVPVELKQHVGLRNPLGLFRIDPSRPREVFRCAPRKEVAGYQPVVDFHDAVRITRHAWWL